MSSTNALEAPTLFLRPDEKPAHAAAEKVEDHGKNGVPDRAISNVTRPSITVYLPPPEKANGMAVVICPGGGYERVVIDKEGTEVAQWLNTLGIAGIVLKYRLPGQAGMKAAKGAEFHQATEAARVAIEDGEDAMKLVRASASKWRLRPGAIGMMGFSAGGNLAAFMGMVTGKATRPDFLVLVYPALPQGLEVTSSTPRTFLAHADDDKLDAGDNSVRFYLALKKAHVPAELHVYASGGHGFALRKKGKAPVGAWSDALAAWLADLRPAS